MYMLALLHNDCSQLLCISNCLKLVSSELHVSITASSFVAPYLLVSEIANVLLECIYCCFTRAILFTTMFPINIWCVH